MQAHKTRPVHYLPHKDEDIMHGYLRSRDEDGAMKVINARGCIWVSEWERERRMKLRIETMERGVQTWQMNLLYKVQLNVGKGHHFSSSASVKSDRAVTSVQASTHPAQTTWQLKVISAPSNSQEGPMWTRTSKYSLSALPFSSFETRERRKIETENNKNPSSRWRGKKCRWILALGHGPSTSEAKAKIKVTNPPSGLWDKRQAVSCEAELTLSNPPNSQRWKSHQRVRGKGWSNVNEINSFTDSWGIFSSGNTCHSQLPRLRWTKTTETVKAWRASWRIINLACKTKGSGREGGAAGVLPSPVPKQLLWESESGASTGLVNERRQSIVHEALPGIKGVSLMKPFKCTQSSVSMTNLWAKTNVGRFYKGHSENSHECLAFEKIDLSV